MSPLKSTQQSNFWLRPGRRPSFCGFSRISSEFGVRGTPFLEILGFRRIFGVRSTPWTSAAKPSLKITPHLFWSPITQMFKLLNPPTTAIFARCVAQNTSKHAEITHNCHILLRFRTKHAEITPNCHILLRFRAPRNSSGAPRAITRGGAPAATAREMAP
jgi:hypothetical protein